MKTVALMLVFAVALLLISRPASSGPSFGALSRGALSSGALSSGAAGDDNGLKQIQERLDALERAVLSDPAHPDHPIAARLASVEDDVKQLQKHDTTVAKTEGKEDDGLHKTLATMQKETDDLARRLKTAEEKLHNDGGDDARTMDQLKRQMEQQDKAIDDLRDRVKHLESKKIGS